MTRTPSEENLLKCSNVLAETKPFESINNPMDNNSPILYNLPPNPDLEKEAELNQLNNDLTGLVEKPMVKLYNIENKEFQKNNIKIDLDIDLYQMEDY